MFYQKNYVQMGCIFYLHREHCTSFKLLLVVIKNTHFNSVVKDWFRDWGSFVPTLWWTQTTLLFFFFPLSFCVHAFLYFVVSCYQLLHFCQGALPASCSPPFFGDGGLFLLAIYNLRGTGNQVTVKTLM